MTTTLTRTTITARLLADLNPDAPAKTVTPEATVRQPDFIDDGFAVYIGEDATVLVEEHVLKDLDLVLHTGGVAARSGHFPVERGIVVQPHTGRLEHVACTGRHAEAQAAWRLAQDTLAA